MQFGDIIGQKEIKARLLNLVREDRLPHALMLFGPPGSGKRSLALALVSYLSCSDRQENDACGRCPSCLKFSKLVHPDLHFVVPVVTMAGNSKPITSNYIEQWRDAYLGNPYLSENQWYEALGAENKQGMIYVWESEDLIRKLGFKPYESAYRMVVIWLPERMNLPVANKLLKVLEEPPEKTLIVMVSESTDNILPTILSRTQLVRVPPLGADLIREGLLQKGNADPQLLEDAVRRANGNFNQALLTLEQDELELHHFELFTNLMRLAYGRKIIEINDWVDGLAREGRERQKQLLDYSVRMLRESFMLHMKHSELSYMSSREAEFSTRFSPFIHGANVHSLVEEFMLAANHIEANGNPKIVLMDLAIKVIRLLMLKPETAG